MHVNDSMYEYLHNYFMRSFDKYRFGAVGIL
jgi:hypothetical protein